MRLLPLLCLVSLNASALDLTRAVVVAKPATGEERTAVTVLVEEVRKRTGLQLQVVASATPDSPAIRIASGNSALKPEAFALAVRGNSVAIDAAGARGVLYAVGFLLRKATLTSGHFDLHDATNIATSPAYPIRGHQLGYRATANSYDAWTPAQFEQYIRELTFFGVNSIEGIPFQDTRPTPVMKFPRREMNRAIADICHRYGLDYWVWTPADIDLKDASKTAELLARFDGLFHDSSVLTGIFVPGGDPGDNPPELVMPFLANLAHRMQPSHPHAKIWLSLQGFKASQAEFVYQYIERERPQWLGGLVAGPSSPQAAGTRLRLPQQYGLRLYPDLTHNKICQFQVPGWDQAYALTLGREAVNPRPAEMAAIHNWFAPLSNGFISYSDGVHDDVNKIVFSALAWNPAASVRDILADYARVYFSAAGPEANADAILALERNWRGALLQNGAVESTLETWRRLDAAEPRLASNWRWQTMLLRASYDAFVRRRLIHETRLEEEANAILQTAAQRSSAGTIAQAAAILNGPAAAPDLRARIEDLCERLFQSIGLQTSVAKYHAIGAERGAVLDFLDVPLNNRWWLHDQFKKVAEMPTEAARVQRLVELGAWEHPPAGSFYDAVGVLSKSPHVLHAEAELFDPGDDSRHDPTFWWWDSGRSRARLTWQATTWPRQMVYNALDPTATYVVRTTGFGQCLPRANGERLTATIDGKEMGEFKEFPIPSALLKQGRLVLTFDPPPNEEHLNWRRQSRLSEVWLLRR